MEFDKSKCYSALNADELKPGDIVVVANSLSYLRHCVECDECTGEITSILSDDSQNRFLISGNRPFSLAYLVERKENCTNCVKFKDCVPPIFDLEAIKRYNCKFYERAEPKTEKHYRPFKDIDELVKVWCEKGGKWQKRELTMPYIWVQCKANGDRTLVTGYTGNEVLISECWVSLEALFGSWEFLDGSTCGVEE